jgi:hypothetical protein
MIIDNFKFVNDHRHMSADGFADLLGNALSDFLKTTEFNESRAASLMKIGRATLNTYTSGVNGERRRPPAELLAKACVHLGFEFEYEGYVIAARKKGKGRVIEESKQLHLEFKRLIDLAQNGAITVGLRKPPGKIELSVSLKEVG